MNEKINELLRIITDYRNDDGIQIDEDHIQTWVNQFEDEDREFILDELINILNKDRYLSKNDAKNSFKLIFDKLADDYNFTSASDFVRNTLFLDLQEEGRSQKELLVFLEETIQDEYGLSIADCGQDDPSNYLYLDDILATGNTIFYDLEEWFDQENDGQTVLDQLVLSQKNVIVIVFYLYNLGSRNLYWRFHFKDARIKNILKYYRFQEIENNRKSTTQQKYDLVYPTDMENERTHRYLEEIDADKLTCFRASEEPQNEEFYTSKAARRRFENIVLSKSFEIYDGVHHNIQNMRPLGFTLPSHKNLGYGALSFTWRNSPNNSPLIFWFGPIHGVWFPLFERKNPNNFEIVL